jgi:hypothetical protein
MLKKKFRHDEMDWDVVFICEPVGQVSGSAQDSLLGTRYSVLGTSSRFVPLRQRRPAEAGRVRWCRPAGRRSGSASYHCVSVALLRRVRTSSSRFNSRAGYAPRPAGSTLAPGTHLVLSAGLLAFIIVATGPTSIQVYSTGECSMDNVSLLGVIPSSPYAGAAWCIQHSRVSRGLQVYDTAAAMSFGKRSTVRADTLAWSHGTDKVHAIPLGDTDVPCGSTLPDVDLDLVERIDLALVAKLGLVTGSAVSAGLRDGQSVRELSESTGVSKSRIHRALQSIRESLGQ